MNYVNDDTDIVNMIGLLSSYIIINKDRLERYPEEMRSLFYTLLGAHYGEMTWKVYWQFLREYKEKMFTSEDAWPF